MGFGISNGFKLALLGLRGLVCSPGVEVMKMCNKKQYIYFICTFMCMFYRSLFVLFLLAIVLSILLRYTDSDYPFGIFFEQ